MAEGTTKVRSGSEGFIVIRLPEKHALHCLTTNAGKMPEKKQPVMIYEDVELFNRSSEGNKVLGGTKGGSIGSKDRGRKRELVGVEVLVRSIVEDCGLGCASGQKVEVLGSRGKVFGGQKETRSTARIQKDKQSQDEQKQTQAKPQQTQHEPEQTQVEDQLEQTEDQAEIDLTQVEQTQEQTQEQVQPQEQPQQAALRIPCARILQRKLGK
ncbi:hypothetical protein Tco_0894554 [Tanacetum coccineum]|uniref:Uncharacterized protein n=1 Tax=Tanacetum coccineum TaxID=301880 RepID=A0ABQ5CEW9_9ASTR